MSKTKFKNLEKVRLLVESCYRCGDCRTSIRPEVGRFLVCPVREEIPGKWEPFFSRGKMMIAFGLLNGEIEPSQEIADIIYQCMVCGSCKSICNQSYHPSIHHPLGEIMDHPKIWEAMRADLIEAGYSIPRHAELVDCCQEHHNPYNEKHDDRNKWIPEGKVFPEEANFLLYTGCTEPYRIPKVLQKIVKILDIADVNYTILNQEEWCCGSVGLRTGNLDLAKELATHNYEAIKKTKATNIITHCAGCYKTFKQDYPELIPDFNIGVIHVTELIEQLLEENKLQFKNEINKTVTYHDPCHLGRHMEVFDPPRNILEQIPGIKLVEMKRFKENSWCCGAGGGVKAGFTDLAVKIAKTRVEEAVETGADILTTSCPFCINNLRDGALILESDTGEPIEIVDIIDLILQAVE